MKARAPAEDWLRDWASRHVEVRQGDHVVSKDPRVQLTATLGSCVSVCLFATASACGGMNHVYRSVADDELGRDAVVAEIERLVNALMRQGVARAEMAARVVGGAHVLPRGRHHGLAIARTCLDYLTAEDFAVVGVCVGGRRARRIRFQPVTGRLSTVLLDEVPSDCDPGPSRLGNAPELF